MTDLSCAGTLHLLLVLLTALVVHVSAQNICPTFGSSDQMAGTYTTPVGLFLDLNNTAQCSGRVTSWTYCFHRPRDSPDEGRRHSAIFMVYRRRMGDSYMAVPNSRHTVTLSQQDIGEGSFGCRTLNLSKQFRVEENDVIGACFIEGAALNMVSVKNGANTHLHRSDINSHRDCSAIGNIDIVEDFRSMDTFRLHLQADIRNSDSGGCTIGSNSQRTEVSDESDLTLIDTQRPSNCSGVVTAWQLCYYTSDDAIRDRTRRRMYTAQVGVWRGQGDPTLVEGSLREVSQNLRQSDEPEPALVCFKEPVSSTPIQPWDMVGVILPDNRPLPIVATSSTGTLLNMASNRTIPNISLHLYAVIKKVGDTNSSSVAIAVVLVLLAAITVAIIFVVLVLWYWWRQRVLRGVSSPEAVGTFKKGSTISKHYRPAGDANTTDKMGRTPTHYKPKKQSSRERQRNSKVTAGDSTQLSSKKLGELAKRESATQSLPKPPQLNSHEHSSSQKPPRPPPMPVATGSPKPRRPPSFKRSPLAEKTLRYETCAKYNLPKELGVYVYAENDYSALLEQNIEEDIYGLVDHYKNPASDKDALYAQLRSYGIAHIKREAIRTLGHLGSGQFGSVELGEWKDGPKMLSVALKTLNQGSSLQDTVKFLQEAATMAQFHHPNVINLHGVIVTGEPMTLVVELADGDLLEHLHRMHNSLGDGKYPNASEILLHYSLQVGLGMQYLSAKGFVHRDLAARNILIKNGMHCKIADFGMSRDLADQDGEIYISSGGKIPIKWTAPEAVQYRKYSTASDIWSYGCVLYEIWSLGTKPFGSEMNNEVIKLLRSGFRLPPPPGCPRVIYEAMIHTWNPDPERRPAFRDTVVKLLGNQMSEHGILHIPEKDARTHPEAAELGADLEAGLLMYRDLQERYRQK